MFNLISKTIDIIKGKERADWVVSTWLRDHSDEYDRIVAAIDKMTEVNMGIAFCT